MPAVLGCRDTSVVTWRPAEMMMEEKIQRVLKGWSKGETLIRNIGEGGVEIGTTGG